MDEKSNLYVFEKKEVFLLFLFMILIALTSFVLGVKMGKNYSYQSAGLTMEDRANVDLLSGQEEDVNKTLDTSKKLDEEELRKDMHESLKKKIMDEMTKDPAKPVVTPVPVVTPEPEAAATVPLPETNKESSSSSSDQFTGKFTIQLSSHRSKSEAAEFSNGFTVRGYDPIVNEVELKGKGTWYRVSLGVFDNVSEAKEYILKEKELFQGQDYVIGRFD
jgi:septal ring-binding cell division protein DamX